MHPLTEESRTMVFLQSEAIIFLVVVVASLNGWLLAQTPDSFLSLDCGLEEGQTYIGDDGITWVSDAPYITTGETTTVPYRSGNNPLNSLRYFKGKRSKYCYVIPNLVEGSYYLVRPRFYYGNYDKLSTNEISFSFIIDTQYWNMSLTTASTSWWWYEFYVPAKSSSMYICLARGNFNAYTPFISSLEIRSLPNTLASVKILKNQYASHTVSRIDFGASANNIIMRYPEDSLDRYWTTLNDDSSPLATIYGVTPGDNLVPSQVLQTSANYASSLNLPLPILDSANYFLAFYFAEISANVIQEGDRVFDIYMNTISTPISTDIDIFKAVGKYKEYIVGTLKESIALSGSNEFIFKEKSTSTYFPLISGMELMQITENPLQSGTFKDDVLALEDVKKRLNLDNWMGDPCLPYRFDWLNCTFGIQIQINALFLSDENLQGTLSSSLNSLTSLEIIELNGNVLTGTIPNLSALKALRTLDLSNNSLQGPIPDWLATLPNLQLLSLQKNNFTGSMPKQLLDKQAAGTLLLSYDSNIIEPTQKKTSSYPIIIGVVIVGVLALVAIIVAVIFGIRTQCCKKKWNSGNSSTTTTNLTSESMDTTYTTDIQTNDDKMEICMKPISSSTRVFSYHDIEIATDNFREVLGKGGSGPVYFGTLPNGDMVAVKRLLQNYGDGLGMFTTEVEILSTVHHLNLVPLVGYCLERDHMLVYKFMQKGTLRDHLYGKNSKNPLSWKTRLLIALGVAEGLDYLHTKCQPRIFHRDVKSDNILLDDNLCAKVSDFGISRSRPNEDATYVETKAMGTRGYADPEMIDTGKFTEKSDVYSFGVVLMEILCGRPPNDPSRSKEEFQIIKAVRHHVRNTDLLAVVDPSLTNGPNCKYNIRSMWTVADIALSSTRKKGTSRPSMKDMVANLTEALKLEFGDERPLFQNPSAYN